jgi:outer membrane lipoprotein LolB
LCDWFPQIRFKGFSISYGIGIEDVLHRKWLICVCLMLIGCAGPESRHIAAVTTVIIQPSAEQNSLPDDPFILVGRLSVKAEQQKFSGGVRWRHSSKNDEVYLFTPLGQVLAEIYRDQGGVRLTTAEPATYQAHNVEYLTGQVLGWELPLAGLQFWVRGKHFPMTVAEKDIAADDRIIAIRQDGWNIIYLDYYPARATGVTLPRLLEFGREDVKIKLIVDQWQNADK